MFSKKTLLGALVGAPLLLSGCGGDDGTFDLRLIHRDCTGNIEFIPASSRIRVTVTGDGIGSPVVKVLGTASSRGSAEMPGIPWGKNRVVTVEAISDSGLVLARGESKPFNLEEGDSPEITVVVRGVDRFASAADERNECVALREGRGGHVAVQMEDGDVLLVGGFASFEGGVGKDPLATAERYDIGSGKFESAPAPCDGSVCYAVGGGRGVLLNDGRVLVAGGEVAGEVAGEPGLVPTNLAMIFDPATNRWTAREMTTARSGHTLTLLRRSGKVVAVGGIGADGEVLTSVEVFDPATGEWSSVDLLTARSANGTEVVGAGRAFHGAETVNDSTVAIAGGIHVGGGLAQTIVYVTEKANGSLELLHESSGGVARLFTPVVRPGTGMVNGKLVVAGGATSWENAQMSGNSDAVQWIELTTQPNRDRNTLRLDFQRAAPCTVALDDRRLLVAGGQIANGPTSAAELLVWNATDQRLEKSLVGGSSSTAKMTLERAWATCTNLGDGRVLVTGGSSVRNGAATNSAEIYTIRQFN